MWTARGPDDEEQESVGSRTFPSGSEEYSERQPYPHLPGADLISPGSRWSLVALCESSAGNQPPDLPAHNSYLLSLKTRRLQWSPRHPQLHPSSKRHYSSMKIELLSVQSLVLCLLLPSSILGIRHLKLERLRKFSGIEFSRIGCSIRSSKLEEVYISHGMQK